MVVYLTFNDAPSGVYRSQVIDVVNFLNQEGQRAKLVSVISLRGFSKNRRKIRSQCPGAIVLPMFPGVKNWKWNVFTLVFLFLFTRPKTVMSRGIFATWLARRMRNWLRYYRVVFDARGAYHAEFKEYRLIDDDRFVERTKKLEQKALRKSDAFLAVSNALVDYWKTSYSFDADNNVQVIPCTLAQNNEQPLMPGEKREKLRNELGIRDHEPLLVYAGSNAGWQSFESLFIWLARLMEAQPDLKLLLMTPLESLSDTVLAPFRDRVILKWVAPNEVMQYLSLADYGLLLRQETTTNRVASPTKFAEYLAAGLRVLISPELGDFSEFTLQNECGQVITADELPTLTPVSEDERAHAHRLALNHFTKSAHREKYSLLLS